MIRGRDTNPDGFYTDCEANLHNPDNQRIDCKLRYTFVPHVKVEEGSFCVTASGVTTQKPRSKAHTGENSGLLPFSGLTWVLDEEANCLHLAEGDSQAKEDSEGDPPGVEAAPGRA